MVTRLNQEIKEKIVNFLQDKTIGASCAEISKGIRHNRITISKYLEIMKAQKILINKDFAQSKIWSLYVAERKKKIIIISSNDSLIEFLKMIIDSELYIVISFNYENFISDINSLDFDFILVDNSIENGIENILKKSKRDNFKIASISESDNNSDQIFNTKFPFEINERIKNYLEEDFCEFSKLPDKRALKDFINKETSQVLVTDLIIDNFAEYKNKMGVICAQNVIKIFAKVLKEQFGNRYFIAHTLENKFSILHKTQINFNAFLKKIDIIKKYIGYEINISIKEN